VLSRIFLEIYVDNSENFVIFGDMKDELDLLLDSIRRFRIERDWAIARLARASGLSWSILQRMDSAEWSPSAATIRRLLAVMQAERARSGKSSHQAA
jgi:ribosome-binding protein aMBF1 (putative translation factor)